MRTLFWIAVASVGLSPVEIVIIRNVWPYCV